MTEKTTSTEAHADESVILGVRGVSKTFVRIKALDDVTMSLRRGESLALVGANGAGKSTLVRILTGATEPDRGTVVLSGRDHRFSSVHDARLQGIGFVPQELAVAPDLTVAENILAGGWLHQKGWVRTRASLAQVDRVTAQVGLDVSSRQLVGKLSPAERRLVMIARSLVDRPRILILDEPTAALADREADRIIAVLRELQAGGMTVVFISHRMAEIERLCDRVVVLRDGRVVMEAATSAENVARAVAVGMARGGGSGEETPSVPPGVSAQEDASSDEVVLRCTNLHNRTLRGVGFEVRRGEVVGLAGLLGSGRTEILRALAGADSLSEGEIAMGGRAMSFKTPADAVAAGIALLPEDRRGQGGLLGLSIRENLVLPAIPSKAGGWLSRAAERRLTDQAVRDFGIKCSSPDALLRTLSGGNQQKVILARWLISGAQMLLLDEPTAGIDVVAKREIMNLVRDAARQGRAAIVASSELDELCEFCDRILVVRNGAIHHSVGADTPLPELARLCGERSAAEHATAV